MAVFSSPALANGEPVATPTPTATPTTATKTLTPEGNLTLVDDISGTSSDDKQFITVVGYTELPSFRVPENPLRTAELSMEQNANQIDGRINNLPAAKDQFAPLQEKTAEHKRAPKHTKSAPER